MRACVRAGVSFCLSASLLRVSYCLLVPPVGDYGFDPLGQLKGKSAKQVEELKLKEIKNGRCARL